MQEGTTRRSPCVLVVEDEDAIRKSTALSLEVRGMTVLQARDGEAAVELFSARAAEIDCVLLDLGLPGLSGEATFEKLLATRGDARIVLVTGSIEESTLERLHARGAREVVRKPAAIDEIHAALTRALQSAGADPPS